MASKESRHRAGSARAQLGAALSEKGGSAKGPSGLAYVMDSDLRVEILARLYREDLTQSQLASKLHCDLSNVPFHIGVLLEHDCIEVLKVERTPSGNEIKVYRANQDVHFPQELWERLTSSSKDNVSKSIAKASHDEVALGLRSGAFEKQDSSVLWTPARVDPQGWKETAEACGSLIARVIEIRKEAAERIKADGVVPVRLSLSLFSFEMPERGRSEREPFGDVGRRAATGRGKIVASKLYEGDGLKGRLRDWAYVLRWPLRVEILTQLYREDLNQGQIVRKVGCKSNLVSSHIEILLKHECIKVVGTRRSRNGKIVKVYGARRDIVYPQEFWQRLSSSDKSQVSGFVEAGYSKVAIALRSDAFEDPDSFVVWISRAVDYQGWEAIAATCGSFVDQVTTIQERASERLKADDAVPIQVGLGLFCCELPMSDASVPAG